MIAGVERHPLRVISDSRGAVLHMLRADAPHFRGFGEVYFSEVVPGAVKAWKRHKRMTQRFAVPVGRIKLVIFDDRSGSATTGEVEVVEIGRPDAYSLVIVPPLLWYGFTCISAGSALLANCPDLPHDPSEAETVDMSAAGRIPYAWS